MLDQIQDWISISGKCWEWIGPTDSRGNPSIYRYLLIAGAKGGYLSARKYLYEQVKGVPPRQLGLPDPECHPLCVNPDHLGDSNQFRKTSRQRANIVKRCLVCGIEGTNKKGRQKCIPCFELWQRWQTLKSKGLIDTFEEFLNNYNDHSRNGCEMCGSLTRRLSYDHSHVTGRFRGMLCQPCNAGVGMLGDNPENALKAYFYLTERNEEM